MIPADVLAKLAVLGLAPDHAAAVASMLVDVERATKAEASAAIEARRANDRDRKARQKHVSSREGTGADVSARKAAQRAPTRAEPETTLSEENTSKEARKHSPPARRASAKHLLPDGFVPNEVTFAKAAERGLTRAQVLDKVEALREWSHGKGEKRENWDAVIQGALRRDAGQPRAGPPKQRGPSFLDIANATEAILRNQDEPPRPPYLRLAQ